MTKGLTGNELVRQFELERANIKRAIHNMREDVDRMAEGSAPSASFDDVFDSET